MYAIDNTTMRGPINMVSPNPAKSSDFFKIISKIQENQIFLRFGPRFMELALGDFADTISESNGVVKPQKLLSAGYPFMSPCLEDAVRLLLGRQINTKTERGILESR
jgi:NAD dependent epimerase/dehydratase family enzyme